MKQLMYLLLTVFCITAPHAVTAQSLMPSDSVFWIHYRRSLEDSLRLYEKIKPAHYELKIVHSLQQEENEGLRRQILFLQMQNTIQMQECQREVEKQKKNRRAGWMEGFGWGGLAGAVATLIFLK